MYWVVIQGRVVKFKKEKVALEKGCVFGYAMSGPVDIQPQKERSGSTTSFYVDGT